MGRNAVRIVAMVLWLAALAAVSPSPARAATLTSPLASFLSGAVRATDGEPLAGIAVEVYAETGGPTGADYVGQTRTAADGGWLIPAPQGAYTLFFSDRSGRRLVERRSHVVHETLVTDLDVTLREAVVDASGAPTGQRWVTGRVIDGSGAGLAGTQVTLYHLYDGFPGAWTYVVEATSATTEATGRYRLSTSEGIGYVSVGTTVEGRRVGLAGGAVAADPGLPTQQPVTDVGDLVLAADPPLTASGAAAVAGEPTIGGTLSARTPRFSRVPDAVRVRWLRDGRVIATGRRYVPVAADLRRRLSVKVRATSGGGQVTLASRAVLVRRATSHVRARTGTGVGEGRPPLVRVRVISAARRGGRIEIREYGRLVGAAVHRGAASTTVRLRSLPHGRHVLRVRYTGNAVTRGSASRIVLRVAAPQGRTASS